jgi:hypothetical protein
MEIENIAILILTDSNFGSLKKVIAHLIQSVYAANAKSIFSKEEFFPQIKKDLEEARTEMVRLGIAETFFADDNMLYDFIWQINNKIVNLSK